ncbi:MAG: four helix bundle protein [Deltaproteobacteria bacterium]|nr:four helix bundle protein [Deltaproteobacteria bacterium]
MEFVATADEIAERLPPGRAYLKDQLRRAANSIPANSAEGVGELTPREKVRFYRMARRSAVECASHLFVIRRLGLVEEDIISAGLEQRCRFMRAGQRRPRPQQAPALHVQAQRQAADPLRRGPAAARTPRSIRGRGPDR